MALVQEKPAIDAIRWSGVSLMLGGILLAVHYFTHPGGETAQSQRALGATASPRSVASRLLTRSLEWIIDEGQMRSSNVVVLTSHSVGG